VIFLDSFDENASFKSKRIDFNESNRKMFTVVESMDFVRPIYQKIMETRCDNVLTKYGCLIATIRVTTSSKEVYSPKSFHSAGFSQELVFIDMSGFDKSFT
jgi:hypothetical protein